MDYCLFCGNAPFLYLGPLWFVFITAGLLLVIAWAIMQLVPKEHPKEHRTEHEVEAAPTAKEQQH